MTTHDELRKKIPTFLERCDSHPGHQTGMVTNAMVLARLIEEIDELRAELAEEISHNEALKNKLGPNCCACSFDDKNDVCIGHQPKVRELEAELERARKDAERYRNIRKENVYGPIAVDILTSFNRAFYGENLDAEIDAAIANAQEKEE